MMGPTARGLPDWRAWAALPLIIESVVYERLHKARPGGERRVSSLVRLYGVGAEGVGEDVSTLGEDASALHMQRPPVDLSGKWTLGSLSRRLDRWAPWQAPPPWPSAVPWRRWAFESAALDLALQQAGLGLAGLAEGGVQPLNFVHSLRLGPSPSIETVKRRLEGRPGLRLKVDVTPDWSPDFVEALSALERVDVLDFKGRSVGAAGDGDVLQALYDRVSGAFEDALYEDPHEVPGVVELLRARNRRVALDARVSTWRDVRSSPFRVAAVNVKPCRFGTLRRLLRFYAADSARASTLLYGGGMDELGVGRQQIQLLAALLHPGGPNDVAPAAYNDIQPPADLPLSPMEVTPALRGFRLAGP